MSAALLSPAQVEAFRKDGYLVVENVLPAAERIAFGEAVDNAVAGRSAGDDRPVFIITAQRTHSHDLAGKTDILVYRLAVQVYDARRVVKRES